MIPEIRLAGGVLMRVLEPVDAAGLADAYVRNRTYLAPWEPVRNEEYYTEPWQLADIRRRLGNHGLGKEIPLALFAGARLVGRFNLAGIVRGPFQSAGLGYWVDRDYAGRGLASAAVREVARVAGEELGLHRIEASTLLHNPASQKVLLNNGFGHIGMAPRYLKIAGQWQDHNLYQLILRH